MLLNNKRSGAWLNYKIMFVNNKWYAWYHEEMTPKSLADFNKDSGGDNAAE